MLHPQWVETRASRSSSRIDKHRMGAGGGYKCVGTNEQAAGVMDGWMTVEEGLRSGFGGGTSRLALRLSGGKEVKVSLSHFFRGWLAGWLVGGYDVQVRAVLVEKGKVATKACYLKASGF